MTKTRNISDLLDANGDVKSGALDNVPASNDASALTTGTLPSARLGTVTSFTSTGIDDNATSTAITIDSSENVGIGNTTMSNFNASARQLVVGSGSGDNGITIFSGTSNNSSLFLADGTTATNGFRGSVNYLHNGDALTLHANATETMRLTNGNVGIGTSNPLKKLVASNSGAEGIEFSPGDSSNINMVLNYNRSTSAYIASQQRASYHRFDTPTTEAMRLTSTGLGIGTSLPQRQLHVQGNDGASGTNAGNSDSQIFIDNDGGNGAMIEFGASNNGAGRIMFSDEDATNRGKIEYIHSSDHMQFSTDNTERMRIGSNGRVGIGTSTLTYALNISESTGNMRIKTTDGQNVATNATSILEYHGTNNRAGYVGFVGGDMVIHTDTHSAGEIKLGTNGSERLVLNIYGAIRTPNNDATESHRFGVTRTNGIAMSMVNSATNSPYGSIITFSHDSPDNNTNYFLECGDTGGQKLLILSDGDVKNHDNSYGAISDERIKQDIRDSNSQWNDIKAVRVRNFKKKDDVRQYGENAWEQIGVVAQELETVSPKLIKHSNPTSSDILSDASFGTLYEEGDEIPEDKKVGDVKEVHQQVKGVSYSVLYMKSIKALQEAMERIETLEAEVTAL